jgi:hypothetical protein
LAVGLSEITCNFDVTKVIMIYQAQKQDLIILHYPSPGPGTGSKVPGFLFLM